VASRLSHDEYRLLVENAPIMIWRANTTMACDYFNDIWLRFTGRTMAEEYGDGWAEGVHPDDFDRCLAIYSEHFARREAFEMEYRLLRADGEYRWIFDRGAPFSNDAGEFSGYIGSCVDVHERRLAQEALARQHEEQLHELRGLLPICSYCRKIRDDTNYWVQLEEYITAHSEAMFSHGICPHCYDRVMTSLGNAGAPYPPLANEP
jgi:PAS domain S-box-containing protein